MHIITRQIEFSTQGFSSIYNITDSIQSLLDNSGLTEGQVLIFGVGSTTGICTLEFEPGLVNHDLKNMLEHIASYKQHYAHNKTWGDDNGASHLRSALIGTSLNVPFTGGKLLLGTWQQIVFIDFDTCPRNRKVIVQFTGC
ncbi:MAG: hypothetical protein KatS3mg031_0811 [Chitinophagales bacterium]|nr:MAG: hypothetical protein KatS3mg031_0811 [Chitinophagales bacterium]